MFIKLTRTDGTPVWMNPEFIVRFEPWKKGSAVAVAGDGDFEVMEEPRTILTLAGGTPATPIKGEPVAPAPPPPPAGEPHKRKTRTRRKAEEAPSAEVAEAPKAEEAPVVPPAPESAPEPAPEPAPAPVPAPAPEPAPAPTDNLFPEPPDEVEAAAAILKKHRCRSRKRIQNTIKSLNPKMSMEAARALLEQMEARGLVIIDAQGHATFT